MNCLIQKKMWSLLTMIFWAIRLKLIKEAFWVSTFTPIKVRDFNQINEKILQYFSFNCSYSIYNAEVLSQD